LALITAWGTRRALSHRSIRLEQTQRLLDQTARSAVVGGWEYDQTTKHLNWTLQTHRIHGSSPESFKPSVARFLELCDEEVVPLIRAAFMECCTAGTAFEQQFRLRTTTGRRIWVSLSGEAENNGGKITRILGYLRDIDHLKR